MLALALTLSLVDPAPGLADYAAARRRHDGGASMIVIGGVSGLVGIMLGWSIAFRSIGDILCDPTPTSTCPQPDYGPDRAAAISTAVGGVAVAIGGAVALSVG